MWALSKRDSELWWNPIKMLIFMWSEQLTSDLPNSIRRIANLPERSTTTNLLERNGKKKTENTTKFRGDTRLLRILSNWEHETTTGSCWSFRFAIIKSRSWHNYMKHSFRRPPQSTKMDFMKSTSMFIFSCSFSESTVSEMNCCRETESWMLVTQYLRADEAVSIVNGTCTKHVCHRKSFICLNILIVYLVCYVRCVRVCALRVFIVLHRRQQLPPTYINNNTHT